MNFKKNHKSQFIQRLQRRLDKAGLQKQELAALLKCKRGVVSRWFSYEDGGMPSSSNIVRLSNIFQCNPDWLRHGIGPEEMTLNSTTQQANRNVGSSISQNIGGTTITPQESYFWDCYKKYGDSSDLDRFIKMLLTKDQ